LINRRRKELQHVSDMREMFEVKLRRVDSMYHAAVEGLIRMEAWENRRRLTEIELDQWANRLRLIDAQLNRREQQLNGVERRVSKTKQHQMTRPITVVAGPKSMAGCVNEHE